MHSRKKIERQLRRPTVIPSAEFYQVGSPIIEVKISRPRRLDELYGAPAKTPVLYLPVDS